MPEFEPDEVGQYVRRYDVITEKGSDDDKRIIADVLEWMEGPVHTIHLSKQKNDKEESDKRTSELLRAGMALEKGDKVAAIDTVKEISHASLAEKLVSVWTDLKNATQDLLSGHRPKTAVTTIGLIAAGTALGAVLGTLVFPLIGTAIGGTVGAAITTGVAAAGGSLGLAIIGAFTGSWLSNKIARKFFKEEHRSKLAKRSTQTLEKDYGISPKIANLIYWYLYNREKTILSPLCKRYYKMLRVGITQGNPIVIEETTRFFCRELELLNLEMDPENPDPKLNQEIEAVLMVLQHLEKSPGISKDNRNKIQKTIQEYLDYQAPTEKAHQRLKTSRYQKSELLPQEASLSPEVSDISPHEHAKPQKAKAVTFSVESTQKSPIKPKQGLRCESQDALPKVSLKSVKNKFIQSLHKPDYGIKNVEVIDKNAFKAETINYRYKIIKQDGERLPDIFYREKIREENQQTTEIMVDKGQLTPSNQALILQILVEHAKAYYECTQNQDLTVVAKNDDEFAIQLMAAALRAGLKPTLDKDEYPENTPERENVMKKAYELAALAPKAPRRVGFVMEPRW